MNTEQFDHFYTEFEELNYLQEIAESQKTKQKTRQNAFEALKKTKDFDTLKKKVIKEFTGINPEWTKNYNEVDSHPANVLPFPDIYDLTELDESNFDHFYKEFEKLDNLFYRAYGDPEKYKTYKDSQSEDEDEDEDKNYKPRLDEKSEEKFKGNINEYYSVNNVIDYNRQEEKIKYELSQINQKWLSNKNDRQLTPYKKGGDLSLNVVSFQFPKIYTLFEKLVKYSIEIQRLKSNYSSEYTIREKQYKFDELKKNILDNF